MATARTISEERVAAQWSRLGATFNITPAKETIDVERLLLDTVRLTHLNGRLFVMAATWLSEYSDYIARRRLAVMIEEQLEEQFRPVMGLLLDWVQTYGRRKGNPFRSAIQKCHAAAAPGPLLDISRRNQVLFRLARQRASPLSQKWGCWLEEFEPKFDALRPAEWIARSNPSLAIRAITGGDLVATIAADADAGQKYFSSESDLARRYGASRASIRAALRKLTLAGYVTQPFRGKSKTVQLSMTRPTAVR